MSEPNYQNYTRFSQFQKLMKENPKLYWAESTQMAMHKLAEEFGPEFFKTPNPRIRNSDGTFRENTETDFSSLTSPAESALDRTEKIEALKRALATLEGESTNEQA
jgi:hypothetical protein